MRIERAILRVQSPNTYHL